jgi:hypothetical protein
MNGDVHVRFWERLAVQFRGPTRLSIEHGHLKMRLTILIKGVFR